jgi:arsenate reductase (thioredoxin)
MNVLFLCTGNSARSILAEALCNHLGGRRVRAFSAGSVPKGAVHPAALDTLRRHGLSTDGLRSKSWDEFAAPDAPVMDLVVTVCDRAAAEVCPVWPGHPGGLHWSLEDPAAVSGSADDISRAFEQTFEELVRRMPILLEGR